MEELKTQPYVRKPFSVAAVRVTEENIDRVARWCKGEVTKNSSGAKYIKVEVSRPLNERQTQAFVGDWVLSAGNGYKVYTNKAFEQSFDPANRVPNPEAMTGEELQQAYEKLRKKHS